MSNEGANVTLILQARMGSDRLPGKSAVLLSGKPMLEVIMERLENLPCAKWLATSDLTEDNILAEMAEARGWRILRGSKGDVLSRFVKILLRSKDDYCLRVTGDNPLVCPKGLQIMIDNIKGSHERIDYMSDFDFGDYPIGAFAEIFSVPTFLSSIKNIPSSEPWHLSHVTSWMRNTAQISSLKLPEEFVRRPGWRWTVDYPEDLIFIRKLTELLGKSWTELTYPEIVSILDKNLNFLRINSGLDQKPIELG
jgi:spore coat polysaccharide biosynthesis protein SpsF (cytidylyltransferase family)